VLALDCATRTGWAVVEDGRVVASGMEDFRRRKDEHPGAIFGRFWDLVESLVCDYDPAALAYEQAHHRGGAATRLCVGMTTRVEEIGAEQTLPVHAVHSSAVKRTFVGQGNADKRAMHDRAWKILMRVPVDDNEADAVALGLCVAPGGKGGD
jgi:Holliday junction resolvasome RuvABC endonuclease subunit